MAFGKRSASDLPPARIAVAHDGPSKDSLMSAPSSVEVLGAVRTVVANPGGIDLKFIALAAGVVVLAAGAAIALPSLGSVLSGGVRPIEEVIANLDRPAVRTALAAEAFPDGDGRAFMTSLATNFPREHGRLLDTLADTAMAGGDRDALFAAVNSWSISFAPSQMAAVGRTGARGFDEGVTLLTDALKFVEDEAGGCSGTRMQQLAMDPTILQRLTKYDGRGYHYSMRASRTYLDLAAAGRNAAAFDTRLTANDNSAIQSAFFSMLADPQVSSIMQMAAAQQTGMGNGMQSDIMNKLNFCQLGRTVLIKLKGLPEGAKSRMFGTLMSQDIGRLAGPGAFSGPNGGSPFSMLQGN